MSESGHLDETDSDDSDISTPEKKDIFIQNAETYVDHIRYQGDGEKNVLARGQQYWATSGEVLKGPFDPQIHFNARLDSIGTAKIVFHHANLGVFCPQTFDSENLENPGWCLGVKIDSDNKLSFLNKTEVDTAWLEIKTVGLPVHSDIRLLGIKATCPTIK